jgi:pilus assembly protein TadC
LSLLDNIIGIYLQNNDSLKWNLKVSRYPYTPEQWVKRAIMIGAMIAVLVVVFSFLYIDKNKGSENVPPYWIIPVGGLVAFFVVFSFIIATPYGAIQTRAREINKEVLFAGRYLLIKLESGEPLFNALIDTSESYGVASKYFREIVDDINTGTPIEDALQNAMDNNASEKLKRIIWQLLGALKTGAEITNSLRSVLAAITAEQIVEIKEYGRKLNSFMMFYLVIAIVAPSLGLTMLVILSSFLEIAIDKTIFLVILFFLIVVQLSFVILIKSSRPMVNL